MLCEKKTIMRKGMLIFLILLLSVMISGCHKEDSAPEKGDFSYDLPEGFTISDVTEKDCAIVSSDGVTVGGMILTDLKGKDLTGTDRVAMSQYLENIAEGSEYFSWTGGDDAHPIWYLTQSFTDPDSQEKREYYRVFFVKDSGVYDLWFDMERIDEDIISEFLPIAESTVDSSTSSDPTTPSDSLAQRLQFSVVEAEEPGHYTMFSKEELGGNTNADILYSGLTEVNIIWNGEKLPLASAIRDGQLTVPEIFALARIDAGNGFCQETYDSEHGLTHFVYTYPECELHMAYDVYETPNGKQTLIEEIHIYDITDDYRSIGPYYYVDEESEWGYFLDREDWGLTFAVSNVSPTQITVNYTQQQAQEVGELIAEKYMLCRRTSGSESDVIAVSWQKGTEELSVPIQSDGSGQITIDWFDLVGALEPGEYYLRFTVFDRYDESELHPLIVKYHDGQGYCIPFSIE